MGFLLSDYALMGPLGPQVVATLIVFGFGWFAFIASSVRTERKRTTQFERFWSDAEPAETHKVFRPWPGLLIWVPVVILLAVVWIVPVRFGGVDLEPTARLTSTSTSTPTAKVAATKSPTSTTMATLDPTATLEPTITPTAVPTATPEQAIPPTQTPDPNKPALACNGVWLHEEPLTVLSWTELWVELCSDGERIAIHDFSGLAPIPTVLSSFSSKGEKVEFYVQGGQVTVNGQPFAEWLAARGGR